jgi:hypothetical protein
MRFFILFLVSFSIRAATPELIKATLEAQPSCANFVRLAEDKLVLGFGHYWPLGASERLHVPSPLRVIPLGSTSVLETQTLDSGIDALQWDDRLFVLTFEGLEERMASSLELLQVHPTQTEDRVLRYREHPTAMIRSGNHILISHGRLGVSVFDLETRSLVKRIPLLQSQMGESQAVGLTLAHGKLFVLMDSFTLPTPNNPPAFRGLIVLDPATLKVERELAGIDPGASEVIAVNDGLLISFLGMPLWKFRTQDLQGTKLPRPRAITFSFGLPGHPTGRLLVDDTYIHGCFMKLPDAPGGRVRNITRSLSRADLKL